MSSGVGPTAAAGRGRGMPRRRAEALAVLMAATGGRLAAASALLYDSLAEVPMGCYSYGYVYTPAMDNITGMPFIENSPELCQARCAQTAGCEYFGYWTINKQCWLGAANGSLVVSHTAGAVSGPQVCAQEAPACSDTNFPGPGFPGTLPEESRAAWPTGQQPTNLQCWPRKANGFPAGCENETATVLEDTAQGWPGRCSGMVKITNLLANETCQSRCFGSPLCAVWAVENASSGDGSLTCWQSSFGQDCFDASTGLQVPPGSLFRAQRVMHGTFRNVMNTAAMHIKNLTKAFGPGLHNDHVTAEKACRRVCLSNLLCQYWQYSHAYGCYVEHEPTNPVPYPLVNNGIDLATGTYEASTFTAGEYLQHTCRPGPRQPLPFDPPGMSLFGPVVMPIGEREPNEVIVVNPRQPFPTWATVLIMVTIVFVMSVVGATVYVSVLDAQKRGFQGQSSEVPYFMKRPMPGMNLPGDSRTGSFDSQSHLLTSRGGGGGVAGGHVPTQHFQWNSWMHQSYHNMAGRSAALGNFGGFGAAHGGQHGYDVGPTRDQLMQYAHRGRGNY